jgi:azurin
MMFIYAIVPGNDIILKALKTFPRLAAEMVCAVSFASNQHMKMQQPQIKTGLFC